MYDLQAPSAERGVELGWVQSREPGDLGRALGVDNTELERGGLKLVGSVDPNDGRVQEMGLVKDLGRNDVGNNQFLVYTLNERQLETLIRGLNVELQSEVSRDQDGLSVGSTLSIAQEMIGNSVAPGLGLAAAPVMELAEPVVESAQEAVGAGNSDVREIAQDLALSGVGPNEISARRDAIREALTNRNPELIAAEQRGDLEATQTTTIDAPENAFEPGIALEEAAAAERGATFAVLDDSLSPAAATTIGGASEDIDAAVRRPALGAEGTSRIGPTIDDAMVGDPDDPGDDDALLGGAGSVTAVPAISSELSLAGAESSTLLEPAKEVFGARYSGPIEEISDDFVLQRVGRDLVRHRAELLAGNELRVGENKEITYERDGPPAVKTQERALGLER